MGRNRLYDRPSVNADSGDVSSPPSFGSIWASILSSRPWRPPKRGAQDLSRTARWRRPQGLSLTDRAPRYAGCDLGASVWYVSPLSSSGLVSGRSSVEVHGSCDDRISLYPAAPVRLATLLHAWTYRAGRMGLIPRTAEWLDHSAKRFLSHTSDLPNAPEGASELCIFHRADFVLGNSMTAP